MIVASETISHNASLYVFQVYFDFKVNIAIRLSPDLKAEFLQLRYICSLDHFYLTF